MAFGFVLVGSGNVARTYVSALSRVAEAELAGVVSRSGKLPAGGADPTLPVAATLAALAADFDGVIVATPNGLHHSADYRDGGTASSGPSGSDQSRRNRSMVSAIARDSSSGIRSDWHCPVRRQRATSAAS